MRKAINNNPQGIVATLSMNNLYMETATELVSVFTLLKRCSRQRRQREHADWCGKEQDAVGTERQAECLQQKLHRLYLSIRYYTMTDVWNGVKQG